MFLKHNLAKVPSTSYPCFNDGGSRVQNALHLPQGRDDKKITSDDSGHRVSWDKEVDTVGLGWGGRRVFGGGWWGLWRVGWGKGGM